MKRQSSQLAGPSENGVASSADTMSATVTSTQSSMNSDCLRSLMSTTSRDTLGLPEGELHTMASINSTIVSPPIKLSFKHKLALSVGAGPITLPLVMTTVYVQMFLLDVARLPPHYATGVIVVARILDAVSDPTVGALVNKTQEKGGSLRKWMLSSLPLSILTFFLLWYVPDSLGTDALFVYYLITYTMLQLAFTLYSIPFCSLVMYQSTDQSERDSATSYRLVGEVIFAVTALCIATAAEWITHSDASQQKLSGCHHDDVIPKKLQSYRETFMIQGSVGAIFILFSGLYSYFTSIENTDIHIPAKSGLITSFVNAMTFPPYIMLAFAYLAGYVAVNITQGCLLLYFKYVIDKEEHFTMAMLALMISGAGSIPLWKFLVEKYGKRKVSFCCVVITVPAFSMLSVITADVSPFWLIVFAMATGPGCACGFYIPWLLLPDVIDDYTRVYQQRNESIFYGFFVFLSKLANGCVSGGTILTLKLLNYDAEQCEQNANVMLALRVICGACPTVLLLVYGLIMYFFPLTEAQMQANQEMTHHMVHLQAAYYHLNSANKLQHENSREEEIFMLSAASTPQIRAATNHRPPRFDPATAGLSANHRLRFEMIETEDERPGSSTPIRDRGSTLVQSPDFTPLGVIRENEHSTQDGGGGGDDDVELITNLDRLLSATEDSAQREASSAEIGDNNSSAEIHNDCPHKRSSSSQSIKTHQLSSTAPTESQS